MEKVLPMRDFRGQSQRKGGCGNMLSKDEVECWVKRESIACVESRKSKGDLKT